MKYVKIGFLLSIGWWFGDVLVNSIDKVLGEKILKSEPYQKICEKFNIKNPVVCNKENKSKVIIGFRGTES